MVKRTRLQEDVCPVARSLDVIGDWWSLLIVRDALSGVRRFSEFQRSLVVAMGMLAARLRDLVAEGVLETAPASDGSAYQEYVLTPKYGCSLSSKVMSPAIHNARCIFSATGSTASP